MTVDVPVIGLCTCVWWGGGGDCERMEYDVSYYRNAPSETQVGLSKNVDIVQVFICNPRLVIHTEYFIHPITRNYSFILEIKQTMYIYANIRTFLVPSLSSSGRSHIVVWWRNVHSLLPHMPPLSFMTSHTGSMNS